MLEKSKYKADTRLKISIETAKILGHRNLIFIHGTGVPSEYEAGTEQIMIIHHLMSKICDVRKSILWCHAKSASPQVSRKQLKRLEKKLRSGKFKIENENAFHIFLLSTEVVFCPYEESQNMLGKTFGMCVIQDFKALTPNRLCRIIETVEGGGCIIFLLPDVCDIDNLSSIHMNVFEKFKTHSFPNVKQRFNKRFIKSMEWCDSCIVLDASLKITRELAVNKWIKKKSHKSENIENDSDHLNELEQLKKSLEGTEKPLPQLIAICRTVDQARAVLKMIDVITEKCGRSTVSISAARGRGKSASLGLAAAAAIYFGVNNIYVCSPSPKNLNTFFEFLFKGFDALDYIEETHYNVSESTNPDFDRAILCVSVFVRHRQSIQYICPDDSSKATQAQLVIIDEAASIPMAQIKEFLGLHNVFMASTINGYEGTGRSLSLKLLKKLRNQTRPIGATAAVTSKENNDSAAASNCRPLHELTLEESIRYKNNDPVEKWLNRLLCLNCSNLVVPVRQCPYAESCQLLYVNRDVLFSGHSNSEEFLSQIVSLLVSSHYKNCPDDLQLLAESPSQHIFVLVPSYALKSSNDDKLPNIFCVAQVCTEGDIPSKVSKPALSRGALPSGDLIPWSLSSHFFKPDLTGLKSVRIVRIATHPDYQGMGYGTRTISVLKDYYKGRYINLDDPISFQSNKSPQESLTKDLKSVEESSKFPNDDSSIRRNDTLLVKLSERAPEKLDYIGVSFGVTDQLFRFWKASKFIPVRISQSENKITGENNCIMINPLCESDIDESSSLPEWLQDASNEFLKTFLTLLNGPFRRFTPDLARNIICSLPECNSICIDWPRVQSFLTGHDLRRLESYSKNLCDRSHITDLIEPIALLFFTNKINSVQLSSIQSNLLIATGLQGITLKRASELINLPIESAIGQFNRAIKRFYKALSEIQESNIASLLPKQIAEDVFTPVTISLQDDLQISAQDYDRSVKEKNRAGKLKQYEIKGTEEDWSKAVSDSQNVISIKSSKRVARLTDAELEKELSMPSKKKKNKTKNK